MRGLLHPSSSPVVAAGREGGGDPPPPVPCPHPAAMFGLLALSLWAAYLGFQWKRTRSAPGPHTGSSPQVSKRGDVDPSGSPCFGRLHFTKVQNFGISPQKYLLR